MRIPATNPDSSWQDGFPAFLTVAPPELITAVEDQLRRVLEHHGASAFAAPREAAIVHEVGHAIVGTHEGFTVRQISIYPQSVPILGDQWAGRCIEGGPWTSGPDSTADDDLHRARYCIAGLAGEAVCGRDKPGSSIDELALSQLIGVNAASKLADYRVLTTDEAYTEYAKRLWHEQIWNVDIAILRANREPFQQIADNLHQNGCIKGSKLRKLLSQVRSISQ
jgi:hypothetical protein